MDVPFAGLLSSCDVSIVVLAGFNLGFPVRDSHANGGVVRRGNWLPQLSQPADGTEFSPTNSNKGYQRDIPNSLRTNSGMCSRLWPRATTAVTRQGSAFDSYLSERGVNICLVSVGFIWVKATN